MGVYDACNAELNANNCMACDSSKQREFENSVTIGPAKCMCEFGWYDPGVE